MTRPGRGPEFIAAYFEGESSLYLTYYELFVFPGIDPSPLGLTVEPGFILFPEVEIYKLALLKIEFF